MKGDKLQIVKTSNADVPITDGMVSGWKEGKEKLPQYSLRLIEVFMNYHMNHPFFLSTLPPSSDAPAGD
jgi:superoxide dismutase